MNAGGQLLIGLVMLLGLFGVVVPVLPGLLLIAVMAIVWALEVSTTAGWVVTVAMLGVLGLGTWFKYRLPQRELTEARVAARTWVIAIACGIAGFFAIPVVGAVLGFVAGVYLGERAELGAHEPALAATRRLVGGIGRGIAVEFTAGLVALAIYVVAALTVGRP